MGDVDIIAGGGGGQQAPPQAAPRVADPLGQIVRARFSQFLQNFQVGVCVCVYVCGGVYSMDRSMYVAARA